MRLQLHLPMCALCMYDRLTFGSLCVCAASRRCEVRGSWSPRAARLRAPHRLSSRTLRAFASAARRERVVRDNIGGDWNCHARDYTRPQNVK